MKKLLALLLLFGIVGCHTTSIYETPGASNAKKIYETPGAKRIHKTPVPEHLRYSEDDCLEMLSTDIDAYLICIDNYKKFSRQELNIQLRQGSKFKEAILSPEERKIRMDARKTREEEKKLAIMNQLKKRCASYGFTGDSNISVCIQREAQHDREITLQKLELQRSRLALQKSQSNSYVQPVAQVKAEEELHWTAKFLLNVVEGAAEAYVNQSQHNLMHSNDKKTNDIHKNCRPNC